VVQILGELGDSGVQGRSPGGAGAKPPEAKFKL